MKFETARAFALSLPETAEAPHHHYGSFRVKGRIFATYPPDGSHLHVFVPDQDREEALELHPEFVEKLFWGAKACGVRVALAGASPAVVRRLVRRAWESKAPKGAGGR